MNAKEFFTAVVRMRREQKLVQSQRDMFASTGIYTRTEAERVVDDEIQRVRNRLLFEGKEVFFEHV